MSKHRKRDLEERVAALEAAVDRLSRPRETRPQPCGRPLCIRCDPAAVRRHLAAWASR